MLEKFLSQYESRQTIRAYRSRIQRFLNYLEEKNKKIERITQKDVITFLQKYSKTTGNNYLTAIKVYYNYITDKQLNIDSQKVSTYRPDRNTALQEAQQMIYIADKLRDKVVIKLLFETGIRVSELARLTLKNIVRRKDQKYYLSFEAKGRKQREIEISKENVELLRKIDCDKETIIGITTRQVQRILRKLSQEAVNKIITPHCLRHGFATELMLQGVSFEKIQYALGHENIATTLKYLHNKRDADSWNIRLSLYKPETL